MLLRTADGVLSTVEVFLNARYGYDVRCEIVGEQGTLALTEPAKMISDAEPGPDGRLRGRLATAVRRCLSTGIAGLDRCGRQRAPRRRWPPPMTDWSPTRLPRPSSRRCAMAEGLSPLRYRLSDLPGTALTSPAPRRTTMSAFPSVMPQPRTPDSMDAPPLRWGVIGPGLDRRALHRIAAAQHPAAGGGGRPRATSARSTEFAARTRHRAGLRVVRGVGRRSGYRRRLHRDAAQCALSVCAAVAGAPASTRWSRSRSR